MSHLHKWIGAFMIWMLLSAVCHAQTIKGTITDSLGKGVSFAGVNLKNSNNIIIAYSTSNDKGVYTLQIPADQANVTGLQVEVSCVGFKKQAKPVTNTVVAYNFKLVATVNQLQTVVVKDNRPRIRTSGDTLSYKVSDFTSPQDRVIEDVIKKLPGIDVAKDGKISYNGKGISNLYIGGDNLLDDKYNIATKNIPNGVVDQVQVIENHQPIKMLKDKVVSDDVALNLTMKKDAKIQLIGQESVGAGLPGNYDEDLNAMMFKDNFKAINYLKGNNTGFDVQADLVAHNYADYQSRIDNDLPATVLSLGTAGNPDLPRNRYLFDQSGILNLNNLVHLKKDVILRANMYYLHDTQRQSYQKRSEIYLPNDTVRYSEVQDNRRRPDILHAQLGLNINKDKYYLNNSFSTDYSQNTGYSALVANGTVANQVFKDNALNISNEFNMMNTFKTSDIIEVYSYLNRSTEPENRVLSPGYNAAVFNNNQPYAQLVQNANVPTWFINNYISYKIPRKYVTQSYKAGFSLQSQKLTSDLSTVQYNNSSKLFSDSSLNNLNWLRNKVYAEAGYDIPGKILKIGIVLPLNLQQINYSDNLYALDKSLTRLYFNPRLLVKYQSGVENYFTVNYGYRNDIGNIQDVYRGDILTNYRTLYANNADLTERQTQNAALAFNYHKAITLFFFSLRTGYTHSVANNITASEINNNLQQRIVLPFENAFDSWTADGFISKYSFGLRTTFSAGLSWQTSRSNQILNQILLPYNTISTTENAGADTKISDQLNVSYKASYTQITSKSSAYNSTSVVKRLDQQASLNYNPLSNLFFKLSGDHYYTHQDQPNDLKYVFADAAARYQFKKRRIDVELSANNLFNTKTYSALYLSANTFTSNTYTIPGRIVLMKLQFNI